MPPNSADHKVSAYSIAVAARMLGVSWPTVARRIEDGTIPAYRVGKAVRIRAEVIDAILRGESPK